jgi:DNA polymerase-1
VTDEQTLAALVDALKGAGQFALDAIATSERSMEADLVGLGFATEPNKAWYVPIGHRLGTQLPADLVLQHLKPVLEDPGIRKLAHNGKFDMTVLANRGITLRGLEADVTIAAYLLGAKALSIKGQAFEKLAEQLPAPSEVIGSGAKAVTFAQAIIEQTAPLSCAQADTALRLWPVYRPLLERDRLLGIFNDIEMPLLPVLERMERTGIAIDVPLLKRMSREMDTQVQQAEAAAYEVVGHEFKINSPKELSNLLFEELNLPKPRKTKTGYSTDAQVLEALRTNPDTSPKGALVIDKVLEYRQVTKLKSTYVDALPTLVNPRTGRVHTTLSQTVAATGRLSSSDPNLQNIPVRTEMGKRIREAFIVQDPGWRMLSADYSQIELRILAHITKDPGLVEAFQRDEDIHASTAARVFDVPIGQVTADQRRFAKVVNFGLLYGMSEFGLATRADMAREKAAPIIEEYFKKYPGIQKYLDDTKKLAREQGYVETLLGRRRYIPEVQAANPQVRAAGERMAINHPAQGTAADIIKIGMIRLQAEMDRMALRARMLLQVHDELIFEAPKDEMDALKGLVKKIMPAAMELIVPLKVDLKEGQTWGEME